MGGEKEGNMQFVLSFDGKNDWVGVADPFENKKEFTISLWVNPSRIDDGKYHGFIGKQGDRFRKPSMWLAPSKGGLHFDSYSAAGKRFDHMIPGFFEKDQWVHLAWTKQNTKYRIYRNGELFFKEPAPTTFYTVKTDYWIGRVDNYFPGRLAEIRIWNKARTLEEIQGDMNRRLQGNEPGLVACWPLDDGEGASVSDKSGSGNHGKISGASWTRAALDFLTVEAPAEEEPAVAETAEPEKAVEKPPEAKQAVEEPAESEPAAEAVETEQIVEETVEAEQVVEEPAPGEAKSEETEQAEPCAASCDAMSERLARAERIVKRRTMVAAGVGLIPVPVVDLVALTGLQLDMIRSLAKLYKTPFNKEIGKSLLAALIGVGVPLSVSPSLTSMIKLIPILGQTTGVLTLSALGGATTYAVGKVFIQHFESGGTFLDFDPEKTKAYYYQQLEKGKTMGA